jgi:replicative DNA helicase
MTSQALEFTIIGTMVNDKSCQFLGIQKISEPYVFEDGVSQLAYKHLLGMFINQIEIDAFSFQEYLKKQKAYTKIGGDVMFKSIIIHNIGLPNFEQRLITLNESYIYRIQVEVGKEIVEAAAEKVKDPILLAQNAILMLEKSLVGDKTEQIKTLGQGLSELSILMSKGKVNNTSGTTTGFEDLDKFTKLKDGHFVIVAARPSMGKCLSKDTGVLMYDGNIKNASDIKKGEFLMGDDSTPRRVLDICKGTEMMYWVRQLHGTDYRVNESHLLSLTKSRKSTSGDNIVNISIKDYLTKSDKWKSSYKGYKRIWLGDGNSRDARITNPDLEIFNYFKSYAKSKGAVLSISKQSKDRIRCLQYSITGLGARKSMKNTLRLLGVLENKHIPKNYLTNSKEIRLKLLAGLIDSDGYVNQKQGHTTEIVSKQLLLAQNIKFLCDSLGYRTSIRKKEGVIKSIGFKGEYWVVCFNGNTNEIPVLLERKKAKLWIDKRDWRNTGITVVQDTIDEYYGFELDGNHLFCLSDCTITHNTAFVLEVLRRLALLFKEPVALFSLEMEFIDNVKRLASNHCRINSYVFDDTFHYKADEEKFADFCRNFSTSPFYIDDDAYVDSNQVIARIIYLHQTKKIKKFAIDHLGLIKLVLQSKTTTKADALGELSGALKRLARKLKITIIGLYQLNREVEKRMPPRPMLSDLTGSGALEADSDVVLLLYRPDYYIQNKFNPPKSANLEHLRGKYIAEFRNHGDVEYIDMEGICEVIIAKNRGGKTGRLFFDFNGSFGQFTINDRLTTMANTKREKYVQPVLDFVPPPPPPPLGEEKKDNDAAVF